MKFMGAARGSATLLTQQRAAFVARDLGDDCADMDRRFEFVITYERALAVRAARSMMRRLATGERVAQLA